MDWQVSNDIAIPKLIDLYGGRLYHLGSRICGDDTDAEDMAQETFLQAYRDWHQFEGPADPKRWLFTIAARVCQRQQRRRSGEPAHLLSLDDLSPFDQQTMGIPMDHPDPELQREATDCLEVAFSVMPEEFRIPLVLKEIIGFSLCEIAGILGLKEATVKTRVHRARMRLRQALDPLLPQKEVPRAAYEEQVCMDLLAAKQESLDRGSEFPNAAEIICERCNTVFSGLDLVQDVCRKMDEVAMPSDVRQRLLDHIV